VPPGVEIGTTLRGVEGAKKGDGGGPAILGAMVARGLIRLNPERSYLWW